MIVATSAAADQPTLEVLVPQQKITVGDRLPVRVVARGGNDLLWGDLTVRLPPAGPWEVVDGPSPITGAHPPAWEVVLAPMAVGTQALPEIEVSAREKGSDPRVIKPSQIPEVEVASVLSAEGEVEPAPLRDPIGVSGFPWEWVLPAAAGALPVVALLAWWIMRRRRASGEAAAVRIPPIDQLEELLDQLKTAIGRDPAEGVCDRLAQGFRRYLERRSGEPALEMTSHELRRLARSSGWPDGSQRSLHRVMQVVDGVRFGKRRLPDSDLRGAVEAAADVGRDLETHFTAREESAEVAG